MVAVTLGIVKLVILGVTLAGLITAVIVLSVELSQSLDNGGGSSTTTNGTSTTAIPTTTIPQDPWDQNYRLSENISPLDYNIELFPKFHDVEKDPTFTGTLTVNFQLLSAENYIPIHQKDLTITSVKVNRTTGGGVEEVVNILNFDAPLNEFHVIQRTDGNDFVLGNYKIVMEYSGSLNKTDLVGFYMSTYQEGDPVVTKKLVTSKFEPTYARRAFPCFDEPDRKANFTISLIRPRDTTTPWLALSNMNEFETMENSPKGYDTVKFNPSVKMSTYLACFIICQFDSLPPVEVNNPDETTKLPITVYARGDVVKNAAEALAAAESVTKYYIDYFGIPYPLPKLDLIGIPDFVSGAMEHWGLVTFRETNMIFDPTKGSQYNIKRVNLVVAHEISHMWFGNLVTMKWWDDLWLNEGFASYMEYKATNNYKPTWELLDQFVIDDVQPVMTLDSLTSSHPVRQQVSHPDQINEIFDTITYSKGSSVIRMLEGFLGQIVFQKGIQNYLNKYKFGNAVTQDLWNELQRAYDTEVPNNNVNVSVVMDGWTLQTGLPVLNVKVIEGIAYVTQSRFLITPPTLRKKKAEDYKWDVPIRYTEKDAEEPSAVLWLNKDENDLSIPIRNSWIKLNVNQEGFYRVNYDASLWTSLTVAWGMDNPGLTSLDRSSLIDDAFSLALTNELDYGTAFTLAQVMQIETAYAPWATTLTQFQKLNPLLRGKTAFVNFSKFSQEIVNTIYETSKASWDTEPTEHITSLRDAVVIDFACMSGHSECLATAYSKFSNWVADPVLNPINKEVRSLGYNYGMQQERSYDNWNKVLQRYLKEVDPQEKSKLLVSLTKIQELTILEMFLEMAWDETIVKGQDYFTVVQSISDNPLGEAIVWDYVRTNWLKLVERFTLNSRSLGRMIPYITKNFDTEIRLREMNDFFTMYPDAGAGASGREQAIERVEYNTYYWVATKYPEILDWLTNSWTPEKRNKKN